MYALFDSGSFYCACKKAFQPKWNNRLLVVNSNDDAAVIDRLLEPKSGKVVIVVVGGERLMRRVEMSKDKTVLAADKKLHSI